MTIASPSCTRSGLTITLTGGFPSSYEINVGDIFTFTFDAITNPAYSMTTGTFSFSILDSSNNVLVSMISPSGVSVTPGVLSKFETIQHVQ